MKRIYLVLILCIALGQALFGVELTKKIEQNLEISKSGKLRVENQFGSIHVEGWEKNKATLLLDIRVKTRREKDAKKIMERINLDIKKRGSLVSVRVKDFEHDIDNFNGSIEFNYYIKCNKSVALELRNQFGNITANGFNSIVKLTNTNGSIEAKNHANLSIHNQFGNIEVSNAKGQTGISNANGSINVFECMGELVVHNAFGNTSVRDCNGSVQIASKNGSLEVENITGERLICENQFGESEITSVKAITSIAARNGNIRLEKVIGNTSVDDAFGEINIKDIQGDLNIRSQNGRVSVEKVSGNLRLSNSFAENIISNIQGTSDISSANGKLVLTNASQPISIENSFASTILSDVNPKIKIETANGHVKIDKLKEGLIDINVKNSFAGIEVVLPKGYDGAQVYETEFGEIKREGWNMGEVKEFMTVNKIDKLGHTEDRIELRTTNGNIKITEK